MRSVVDKYKLKEQTEAYVVVYRDGGSDEWRQSFIKAAREDISQAAEINNLVIEGAIANNSTLKSIFSDELKDFMFVYLHPGDRQAYIDRINKRLVAGIGNGKFGLPKSFWSLTSQDEKVKYTATGQMTSVLGEAIDKYVDYSMKESINRLVMFQKAFSDIIVVDI
jgi:hypothetical protein